MLFQPFEGARKFGEFDPMLFRLRSSLPAVAIAIALTPALSQVSLSAAAATDDPRQGDRWTYEVKDEITGQVTATITDVVVEVNDKEINVRLSGRGGGHRMVVYDKNWNRIDDERWQFEPNDGTGATLPLEVGKEWRSEFDAKSLQTATTLHGSLLGKVTGKETVTTKAGTFDAFKVTDTIRQTNTKDETKSSEMIVEMLYAPTVNHWVKRRIRTRIDGRLRTDETVELVDYSRKP